MIVRLFACILALGAATSCQAAADMAHDFLPRTHTTLPSPDGRYTAFVRQGLNNDPPDDHLYLRAAGGPARKLMDLAGDIDWCTTIVWTADSRRVGFLIRDQRLAIFDAAGGSRVAIVVLVDPKGAYPGPEEARNVTFSEDGASVSFDRVVRATVQITVRNQQTHETVEAPVASISKDPTTYGRKIHHEARVLGRETVQVPAAAAR